jgi:DNA (cytosine-5)-methyltransferase 1
VLTPITQAKGRDLERALAPARGIAERAPPDSMLGSDVPWRDPRMTAPGRCQTGAVRSPGWRSSMAFDQASGRAQRNMPDRVKIIDLFAGAGGIGVGATLAGGDLRLSVELDPVCCETLRRNAKHHPGEVLPADVSSLCGEELRERAGAERDEPLIIVGGPPCQPFSKAAYWLDPGDDSRYRRARARGETAARPKPITKARPDERRSLVEEFLERIREADAAGFVFENVPSITHPRNVHLANALVDRAKSLGYMVQSFKANAVEYGVAQIRQRYFILGAKRALPAIPARTHSYGGQRGLATAPALTAGKVLAPFDHEKYREDEEVVEGRWAKELREIEPGWNYKYLTAWAGRRPVFEAETRFWNFLLKLHRDLPSWTIAANPGPWIGPFHWDSRRLRVVEMAALQSFPKGYVFAGNRREKVRQVGNAAPPELVKHMVRSVLDVVAERRPSQSPRRRSRAAA